MEECHTLFTNCGRRQVTVVKDSYPYRKRNAVDQFIDCQFIDRPIWTVLKWLYGVQAFLTNVISPVQLSVLII
jgi:hypothetical protein